MTAIALIIAGGNVSYLGGEFGLSPDWSNLLGRGNINSGFRKPPPFTLKYTEDYRATMETNLGTLEIDLLERAAPNTVNNFVFLSEQGYYNGTSFHRIIKDVLIQGGDRNTLNNKPEDDGFGDPGYQINDEINWDRLDLSSEQKTRLEAEGYVSTPVVLSENIGKYFVAMANEGIPNTNGSQFFIVFEDSDEINALNGRHTVFGKIIGGLDVLTTINNVEVDTSDPNSPKPKNNIIIKKISINIVK
ncbi:peptidylprolyl isomerase [Candidatus Dojkabacteria bacterium]|nr:peptidylprolyl isomerase [Candidatus Dojkabacteria bacterium]